MKKVKEIFKDFCTVDDAIEMDNETVREL